jgi:hypothetical protein
MKTLLATIVFSSLLTCQSPASVGGDCQWSDGDSAGVGVRATCNKHNVQDPKPAAKKQDPKPAKQQDPKPAKKQDPKKQDPKPAKKQDPKPAKDPKKGLKEDPKSNGKEVKEEPRIDRPDENQPVPTGTDPADIAAMQSAENMLRAEKRLQQEIKAGKITGLDKILPFDELTSWPYEDGLKGMPKRVKKLSGKKVLMTGFMLPIDEVQNIKEFLLVESLWSCCYGQPPDIHGIVRVVMPEKKTTDYFFDPLKLVGTFKVEATMMDGYCVDIYQLHCETLEALKFK